MVKESTEGEEELARYQNRKDEDVNGEEAEGKVDVKQCRFI